MDSIRNVSCRDSGEQSLQQRKSDHASHDRRKGWLEKAAQSIKEPQYSAHRKSEHRFREAHRSLLRERCESVMNLLGVLVGLHHTEKVSLGIL
jgi:hypothetical protein